MQMLQKSLLNKENFKSVFYGEWSKTRFFKKPHLTKPRKTPHLTKSKKYKHSSFFKAFNWSLLKFDFIHILSRTYYYIDFLFWFMIDLLIIFLNDWSTTLKSTLNIVLLTPVTILSIIAFINLIRNIFYKVKYNLFKEYISSMARVCFASGGPGSGKSSLTIVITVLRAKMMWLKLKFKAFSYRRKNYSKLSDDAKKDYDEVINSYNYFIAHPNKIPCLFSNIPIKDYHDRFSYRLTKDHLFQKKRLPLYSVLFSDEIGNQFKATKGTNTNLEPLSQLARFIRHFFDGAWHCTEQEISKTFIDIRRVSGSNLWLYRQTWVMKPKRLSWLFDSLKSTIMYHENMLQFYKSDSKQYCHHLKASKRLSKLFSPFLNFLYKLICGIGWRKYEAQELGNFENGNGKESAIKFIYVPACLNAKYSDRTYRALYSAKNLPLVQSEFTSLNLTEEELVELFKTTEEIEEEKKEKENGKNPKRKSRKKSNKQ